jgi:hypothetical protein
MRLEPHAPLYSWCEINRHQSTQPAWWHGYVVESLPSMREALGSIPAPNKKRQKKKTPPLQKILQGILHTESEANITIK